MRHNNSRRLLKCLRFGAEDDEVCACVSPHFTCGVTRLMIPPHTSVNTSSGKAYIKFLVKPVR